LAFPVVQGQAVLIRPDNPLLSLAGRPRTPPPVRMAARISRYLPSPSLNLSRTKCLQIMLRLLRGTPSPAILVVGSGKQKEVLISAFRDLPAVRLLCTDIAADGDVDILCDAHDLPFADASFDALITTAVIEHVMYPERVALELHRVLKPQGVIYSELPFIQQVHEGAHDFTRYSHLGHRRLLNRFSEIESGMCAGPATALVWSIEHFFLAFARPPTARRIVKACVRLAASWLKYFDLVLRSQPQALDGASCTYFLGRRIDGTIPDASIVAGYWGNGGKG
jgi:SAM-dependent methyltransferase